MKNIYRIKDKSNLTSIQKLLLATNKLLKKENIESITVAKITDAANLGYGTFYKYFKSTEDIFKEIFSQKIQVISSLIFEYNKKEEDKLYGFIRGHSLIFYYICDDESYKWLMRRPSYFVEVMEDNVKDHALTDLQNAVSANQISSEVFDNIKERLKLDLWLMVGALEEISKGGNKETVCRSYLRYVVPQDLTPTEAEELISRVFLNIENDLDSKIYNKDRVLSL